MQEGVVVTLEYGWPDGVKRAATLLQTDIQAFPPRAFDPDWSVREIETNNSGNFEWLNYITLDGTAWSAKVHAVKEGGQVRLYFEHKHYPGGEDTQDEVGIMNFVDWEGRPWEATILGCIGPFPAQPTFRVRRLA